MTVSQRSVRRLCSQTSVYLYCLRALVLIGELRSYTGLIRDKYGTGTPKQTKYLPLRSERLLDLVMEL